MVYDQYAKLLLNCASVQTDKLFFKNFSCFSFSSISRPYSLTFSPGVYLISLLGAAGGYTIFFAPFNPGFGGRSQGIIRIKKPIELYLFVGSRGNNSTSTLPGQGGYNGGVVGGYDFGSKDCPAGGSGGATDIRLKGGNWNDTEGFLSRIIVAGGGGSPGCYKNAGAGGHGGGLIGEKGGDSTRSGGILKGGEGGNQTSGSFFGYGEKGQDGKSSNRGEGAGSGGAGYWGGFGGETGMNAYSSGGGGGGSSFISGHPGCIARDSKGNQKINSYHYSGLYFYKTVMERGVNNDNGIAYIRKIANSGTFYIKRSHSFLYFVLLTIIAS